MIERIPDLTYNGILPTNALFPWYNPFDDKTYSAKMEDIQAGAFNPDDAWNPAFIYSLGDIATDGGKVWISTANGNLGNPPGPASAFWDEEPDPTPPVNGPFWPLVGNADLTGSVGIKGSQIHTVIFGADDLQDTTNNELLEFYVYAGNTDGFSGAGVFSNLSIFDTGANFFSFDNGDYAQIDLTTAGVPSKASMSAGRQSLFESATISVESGTGQMRRVGNLTNGTINNLFEYIIQGIGSTDGFGMRIDYSLSNLLDVPVAFSNEVSLADSANGSEDHLFKMRGYEAGVLSDFMAIRGDFARQFQVFGPLKLYEDATPPAAADHEGALIWTGTAVQFSDGSTWNTIASGVSSSGTYTPTITNVSNVSASTPRVCQWMRAGNVVTVSGRLDITSTSNNTTTQFYISLPVASNFASGLGIECAGSAVPGSSAQNDGATVGQISGDPTVDAAFVDGRSGASGIGVYFFHFTYLVI